MESDHLLGFLAQRFSISEENVASESLTWILRRSEAARIAMTSLVNQTGIDVPAGLTFVGQVGNPETGRPDVVGIDEEQRERLLIEVKFAAQLTENQPRGYLKRFDLGSPGVLLVVAPTVRLSSLWAELLRAMPETAERAPSPSMAAPDGLQFEQVGRNALALVSWRSLVTAIRDALVGGGESALDRDAEQLLALTEVMDSNAYLPLQPGDLSQRVGRQVDQLGTLIDEVRQAARGRAVLSTAGTGFSRGKIYYGYYLAAARSKKSFWYGLLARAWNPNGTSPLWASIPRDVATGWTHHRLAHALAPFNYPGEPGLFPDGDDFLIPLKIPVYASFAETVENLLDQLELIAQRLDAAVDSGETVIPQSPALEPDDDGPT
jgi:hypothetical protein